MPIINISQALNMESQKEITIYHTGVIRSSLETIPSFSSWGNNFKELTQKFRKIPRGSLLDFISFDFIIEHKTELLNQDPPQIIWEYMYGKSKDSVNKLNNTKGKYVYVLTNVAYPNICKIGKTINPISRVNQINGAGTVSEWEIRWVLPVSDDYKLESLVHNSLKSLRMSSFQGSSREFFEISLEEAIQVIENLGEVFKTSNGIYYD
jgi:hypothetical protein